MLLSRRTGSAIMAAVCAISIMLTGCSSTKNTNNISGTNSNDSAAQSQTGDTSNTGSQTDSQNTAASSKQSSKTSTKSTSTISQPTGKQIITFMGWGSLQEKTIFTKMIAAFSKKYPNIKVNYQHVPSAGNDYMVKLSAALQANKMPDVFYMHTDYFYPWVNAGRMLDLQPYLNNSSTYKQGLIWDKAIQIFKYNKNTKLVGVDGDVYGLPKDLGPWAMVYNKTLFNKKGVALPSATKAMTWDQFVQTAKQLTSGSGVNKVYGAANYTLESAVWSNNADFLSSDKTKVTVNTPQFAQALQWVADLSLVNGCAPSPDESAASGWFQRWCNGNVGMAWMGPWDQATFWSTCNFEWDIMPTPVSPYTGKGVTWLGSAAFCVSATSKYKDSAYLLSEFLTMDKDAQVYNYQNGQAVPNIISMAKNDYLKMNKNPANKQVFLDIIQDSSKSKYQPLYGTYDSSWYDYFNSEIIKVWNGSEKATSFVARVQPGMQSRLDNSRKNIK